jgi:carbonic anhydrase
MSTPAIQRSIGPAISAVTARNQAFAAAGGHRGATPLSTLRLFVVTCLDPRTDPAHLLGLKLSEAFIVRNIGGRVTDGVIADVAFVAQIAQSISPDGQDPFFEVAIIHHNQCGTMALADDGFRSTYAGRIGADEAELREHAVLDPRATVAIDVERLRQSDAIPSRVLVSGHVYDVTTGLLETTIPAIGCDAADPAPR